MSKYSFIFYTCYISSVLIRLTILKFAYDLMILTNGKQKSKNMYKG